MQFSREEEITAELNMGEYVVDKVDVTDKAKQTSLGKKSRNMTD